MENNRITFEITDKDLEKLSDKEGFISSLEMLKENRKLSEHIKSLLISDFENIGVEIDTDKISKQVSKEIIKELQKLNFTVNKDSPVEQVSKIELNDIDKKKLLQLE